MRKSLTLGIASLTIISFLGCSGDTKGTSASPSTGDPTGGGGSSDTAPTTDYFYVHATSLANLGIFTHKRDAASWDTKCQVDLTDTNASNKDIQCVVEMQELDAYYANVTLNYNVPSGTKCAYVVFSPYFFFAYHSGGGPTAIAKTISSSGVVSISSTGGEAGSTPSVVSGKIVCGFDYTNPEGTAPNCCVGKYQLTTTDNTVSPATTTVTTEDWGGKLSNCLGGTGRDFHPDSTGWPRAEIVRLAGSNTAGTSSTASASSEKLVLQKIQNEWGQSLKVTTPVQQATESVHTLSAFTYEVKSPLSVDKNTNLFSANYINVPATTPAAFNAPASYPNRLPNPDYSWTCYDEAGETQGRIRLQIREWNLVSEFAKKEAGNPDTSGSANTRWDWDDFINASIAYPTTY